MKHGCHVSGHPKRAQTANTRPNGGSENGDPTSTGGDHNNTDGPNERHLWRGSRKTCLTPHVTTSWPRPLTNRGDDGSNPDERGRRPSNIYCASEGVMYDRRGTSSQMVAAQVTDTCLTISAVAGRATAHSKGAMGNNDIHVSGTSTFANTPAQMHPTNYE